MNQPSPPSQPPAAPDAEDRSRNLILIVDDEERGRDTLEMLLEPEGYTLALADSGQQALDKAREIAPDLILLDVMMPGMDGFETCQAIRKDPVLADVPVVFVTALDDRSSRLWGLDTGADDYITKPINRNELRVRVRSILRLNRYRKLLTERLKFEWAVEKSVEGYVLLDAHNRVEYANSAARRYLGSLQTGAEASEFLSLAQATYHCEPASSWRNWPQESEDPRYLVRMEDRKTAALWLQVDSFRFPAQTYAGYLLCLRDVSEQVASLQYGWSFRGAVYHKLRTPLNVLNALNLVVDQLRGKIDPDLFELLEVAQRGKDDLQQRILSILDYIEASYAYPESESACQLDSLREMLEQLGSLLGVEVSLRLPEALQPQRIKLNPQRCNDILHELLRNAKKFHPTQQPKVSVEVATGKSGAIVLRVSDDGIHLPVEVQDKVWVPFFQAERSFTGEVQGVGLGLPTIATSVWSAGGSCRLYNRNDGPGVVVELSLPTVASVAEFSV